MPSPVPNSRRFVMKSSKRAVSTTGAGESNPSIATNRSRLASEPSASSAVTNGCCTTRPSASASASPALALRETNRKLMTFAQVSKALQQELDAAHGVNKRLLDQVAALQGKPVMGAPGANKL